MAAGKAERGAAGLPLAAAAERDGCAAAPARLAAAAPFALTDGWEDWPAEVWGELRNGTQPLTGNRVRKIAARICRESRFRYGPESSVRFKKFNEVMSTVFGPVWRIRAQHEEVFAQKRLE